ncbi:unnamed protein product [Brachionus calyciflorus]|uniref:Uncharacterized protein n=1 Tax=Brachionus calyciflorus TaxID=104777 RepID=A0A813MDJ0_9BILA|nr:unnamed protein product [Brachionus calyciflorus]
MIKHTPFGDLIEEKNGNEIESCPKSKVILKHIDEFSENYEGLKVHEDNYNKDLNSDKKDFDYSTENIETKIIKYLLNQSISDIEKEIGYDTMKKKEVLHLSVEHGNLKYLLLFYEWLAEKIEENQSEKKTDIINDLLNENFTKCINFNKEANTNSLIFTACKFGRVKILQALKKLISCKNFLSILNEKEKDEYNNTVLHVACLNGDTETICFIFSENFIDLKNELNKKGEYPIDCFLENIDSASYNDKEIL